MKDFLIAWKDAAPAFGAIVALLSAIVAFLAFRYTRAANRRRATLDMVMKTLMDDAVQKRYKRFKELVRKDEDSNDCFKMSSLAAATAIGTDDRQDVLHQMNIYELMALGIKRGVFDEAFYKRWYHNQFMMDYEGAKELVDALQANKRTIFCESTNLYRKWVRDGHPESSPGRVRMAWWGLTRQYGKIDAARTAAAAR